jgi:DNA gyrase/topoisomerase IV subunit B
MAIGKELSPILEEIENTLLDNITLKPEYTKEGFRAAIFIFQSAISDKMFELQTKEKMSNKDSELMAKNLGDELRNLIGRFTGIDTHKLFSDESAKV